MLSGIWAPRPAAIPFRDVIAVVLGPHPVSSKAMHPPSRPYIEATVSNVITIQPYLYPEKVAQSITESLTLANLEKQKAIRLGQRGASQMPDNLFFYVWQDETLIFPRGFAHELGRLMHRMGYDIVWNDRRVDVPMNPEYVEQMVAPVMRDYQEPMVKVITDSQQGILHEPPSSGKTVVTLEALRRLRQRALILIHKKEIAAQWQERCEEFLKVPMGFIGDGKWDEQDITVALIQTLTSKKDKLLSENWYSNWGAVVLDEAHQVSADTRINVVQNFPSRILFGLSATPGKQDLRVAEIMLGPAMQPLSKEEMYERGILIRPKIYGVVTGYWAPPNMKYQTMEKQLIDHPVRNQIIADKIIDQQGSCQLVVSRRLRQLDILKNMCEAAGVPRCFMLTGQDKLSRRQEVIHDAQENGNCVVFSTLADEALDIPIADRLHLAFPVSKLDLLIQIIGRIQRKHKANRSVIVYDYRDLPGPMARQWQNRVLGVYKASDWPVQTIRSKDFA
jgi:superfamily II DNA or RNA helicase